MGLDFVRMPPEISNGFTSALDFGTDVVEYSSEGASEDRVRTREKPARRWQASKGIFTATKLEEFTGFLWARGGAFHGFRFWDPGDFSTNSTNQKGAPSALDQFLGFGDGVTTTFALRRTYRSTDNDLPQRLGVEDRFLPIVGEVDDRLAKCIGLAAGTTFNPVFALDAVTTAGTVNMRTRSVTFGTAPGIGVAVTWGGYYDWPVRLGVDADRDLEAIRESWDAGNVPNIPLVGIPYDRFTPETDDPGGCKALAWSAGTPVLNKAEAKVWELTPASALSCAVQEISDLNYGGPHLILINRSAFAITVKDELTGATIVTLAAAGSSTASGLFFVRGTGAARAWFYLTMAA